MIWMAGSGLAQTSRHNSELKYRSPRPIAELEIEGSTLSVVSQTAGAWISDTRDPPQDLEDFFLDDTDMESADSEAGSEDDSADEDDESDADEDGDEADKMRPSLSQRLPSIRTVSLDASVSPGIMPRDHAAELFDTHATEFQARGFQRAGSYGSVTHWHAPWVAYRPLFFEDVWLERHGYDYGCLQPFVSAAKFYSRIPVLPYMAGANPCRDCVYSLGWGRPGDCPPHFFTLPKKSRRGLLYQAGAVSGLVLLTP